MSQTDLALDVIRKKVFFHNSVDVWISACEEKNIDWNSTENYKKFIEYLLKNDLQLKAFNLCAHEAGATEEEKTKFTELLAEEKNTNPNAATYTIKLNDKSIDLIRKFSLSWNHLFNFGLTILSNAFPINTNARPVMAIKIPGGTIHHQNPWAAAP